MILLYHRVCQFESDPWGICVTPAHFAQQLEVLRRHFRVISLAELLDGLDRGNLPRDAIVITFDDGYYDNLEYAKPVLEACDAPATLFVTSGAVGRTREFWWDELERLLFDSVSPPSEVALEIEGHLHCWELGSDGRGEAAGRLPISDWRAGANDPTRRHSAYYSIYRALRPLSSETQESFMAELRVQTGRLGSYRPRRRIMARQELVEMARGDLVEIGSHTIGHPLLSALSAGSQKDEIEHSKQALEEILGEPVRSFAYPHGGANDFTVETERLVREAGYSSACAAFGGIVRRSGNRFRLPRFGVDDWDGEEFKRRLSFAFAL